MRYNNSTMGETLNFPLSEAGRDQQLATNNTSQDNETDYSGELNEQKSGSNEDKELGQVELLRQEMLAFLEKHKIIEILPDSTIVVDTDFFNQPFGDFVSNSNIPRKFPTLTEGSSWQAICLAFDGLKVISRNDYEQAQEKGEPIKTKPLFYIPENPNSAFNMQSIKSADFYLGPDILKHNLAAKQITESGESVGFLENELAFYIYSPRYGNGYRDAEGNLMVWWPKQEKFQPISTGWFKYEMHLFFGVAKELTLHKNPKLFLSQKTPELVRRNLLTPEDFRMSSGSKASEIFRSTKPITGGVAMLESVRYYFGRGKEQEKAEATVLAPGLGGVMTIDPLSKRRQLGQVFDLLKPGDARLKFSSQETSGHISQRADQKTTNTRPFNPEEFYPKHADEDSEAYARRLKAMEDIDYLLAFSDRLSTEAQVNLSKLPFEEQCVIVDAVKAVKQKPERIISFAREYNLDGLRAFVSCMRSDEYGERVLTIAERYPQSLARDFFHEYSRINFAVQDLGKEIAKIFGEEDSGFVVQFQEALTRRMKDIVNTAYQLANNGEAKASFYGRELETNVLEQPVEAMREVCKMVELIKYFLSEQETASSSFKFLPPVIDEKVMAGSPDGISNEPGIWKCFRFSVAPIRGISKNRSHLMVQLRKYGAPVYVVGDEVKSMHNSKIEFDGEARINFVWIPKPADAENVSLSVSDSERCSGVSFRMDREGKVRTPSGNLIKEKNDPTRMDGELSLEIGGVRGSGAQNHDGNTRIGETIAIGQYFANQHDQLEAGKLPQYYHNRASFSAKYGRADFFANLVEKMASSIEARYAQEGQPEQAK